MDVQCHLMDKKTFFPPVLLDLLLVLQLTLHYLLQDEVSMFIILLFVRLVNQNLSFYFYRANSIKEYKKCIWKMLVVSFATVKTTAKHNSYSKVSMFDLHDFPLMQFLHFYFYKNTFFCNQSGWN